jgi:hypothetical protein
LPKNTIRVSIKVKKILGWSMTKSITSVWHLQKQGKYDIYKPPGWQNDSRKMITTNDLLHMNSGLEWKITVRFAMRPKCFSV